MTKSSNAEGIQGPLNQRSDLKEAKKHAKNCMTNIQQSMEMETNLSLLGNKSGNGLVDNLKVLRNTTTDMTVPEDDLTECSRHHISPTTSMTT